MTLAIITFIVFIINIPFGYWRANVREFSLQWVLAIHIPVSIIIVLRIFSDIGFDWYTYVFLVAAFFSGQKLGHYLSKRMQVKYGQVSSFVFRDLMAVLKANK